MNTTKNKCAPRNGNALAKPHKNYSSNKSASLSRIEQALTFIDPHDRETWISSGMAIKSELGESGFDAWDRWSAGADNYDPRAALASWKSFSEGGKVKIGTLFHYAMQNGYIHNTDGKREALTAQQKTAREAKNRSEDVKLALQRADAAAKAGSIWNAPMNVADADFPSLSEHPYLVKKCIQSHGAKVYQGSLTIGGMDCNGAIMIPIMLKHKITSLQFINCDGEKRFLPGGEKGGYLIGKMADGKPVCIAEGFATGASIHEATGFPVIAAFDAGNMRKMAEVIRANMPDAVIVLCADNDESGTGQRKATDAALAVCGLIAIPSFCGGLSHE
jgi:putative DNA primase/helicase